MSQKGSSIALNVTAALFRSDGKYATKNIVEGIKMNSADDP
jgi:hypothetical protein